MFSFVVLAVLYQFKHWICDYPLQGAYMLGKFKKEDWVKPLASHCLVHAAFTACIILVVGKPQLLWLAAFDFAIHFVMDRIKASPDLLGKFKFITGPEITKYMNVVMNRPKFSPEEIQEASFKLKANKYFWWILGIDQMVHHLTHYYIIWRLVS